MTRATKADSLKTLQESMRARRTQPARSAPRGGAADAHAAHELVLYIENTSDLAPDGPRGQGRDTLLNALRKWRKGTYDPERAVALFGYLVETGAKRYAKEFGEEREWHVIFSPATRREAARQLEASFRNSAEQGEYDHVDTKIGARETSSHTHASRVYEASHDRPISMTYGTLPAFEKFTRDIRRPDPDHPGKAYWPEGTRYPMELTGASEIALADSYGLPEFRAERHRSGRNTRVRGFSADENELYGFLAYLIEQFENGDEEAGDLASSIMTTLGYEWI